MIRILNRHHNYYIGRGTPLGNKYVVGVDGNLEECINKYKIWLDEQIKVKNKEVCNELNKIYKTALCFDIGLICSCAGFRPDCHARIIMEVLESKAKENGKIDLICEDRSSF